MGGGSDPEEVLVLVADEDPKGSRGYTTGASFTERTVDPKGAERNVGEEMDAVQSVGLRRHTQRGWFNWIP